MALLLSILWIIYLQLYSFFSGPKKLHKLVQPLHFTDTLKGSIVPLHSEKPLANPSFCGSLIMKIAGLGL